MHTFLIYATFTTTHDFVPCRYLFKLVYQNVTYCRITNDYIIFCVTCLLKATLFWWDHHAIMKFLDRRL